MVNAFNVKGVEYDRVSNQKRFNEFGVPRNSTSSTEIEKVPNANYLWINQFITALKDNGKAALVMPNGASTANDGGQKEIRKRLIESGYVSQIVILPSNMFNTVTLPATLWFFDKTKKNDEILFINSNKKELYTQVDRAHRKFDEAHIQNLALITRLYQRNSKAYKELIEQYRDKMAESEDKGYWQSKLDWVQEKFPNGEYLDIDGLCRVVKITGESSIESKDWSLSPGMYAGAEQELEDSEPFEEKMERLTAELKEQFAESIQLQEEIRGILGGLGYEI